jgi:hypothetical protein
MEIKISLSADEVVQVARILGSQRKEASVESKKEENDWSKEELEEIAGIVVGDFVKTVKESGILKQSAETPV